MSFFVVVLVVEGVRVRVAGTLGHGGGFVSNSPTALHPPGPYSNLLCI